jgi:replicative DNA helicase
VAAEDLRAEAFDLSVDRSADELLEMAEARLYAVAPKQANVLNEISFRDAAATAVAEANDAHQRGTGLAGYSTGFRDLDSRTGGLCPGNLIIIAGRPSMGKTAFSTNIADNLARSGVAVGFYSLEMTPSELSKRILARHSGVAVQKIARGTFHPSEMTDILRAQQTLRDLPLTIDATGGLTVAQLRAKARRLRRKGKLDVLFVDYLQLMQGTQKAGNRVADVTEITTGLKALAKELDVPVVALSQLNRSLEARDNKRPQIHDLRESGSIEQDADLVLMCYRDDYYVERAKPSASDQAAYADWLARLNEVRGRAEIIVAKARQGTLGTVDLMFEGATTTFRDAEVQA